MPSYSDSPRACPGGSTHATASGRCCDLCGGPVVGSGVLTPAAVRQGLCNWAIKNNAAVTQGMLDEMVSEVVLACGETQNAAAAADNERLRAAMREALAAFRLQDEADTTLHAIGRAGIIIRKALGE